MVGAIWFQFPPSWRTDAAFRKKVKFLLLAQMFILVMSLQYWVGTAANEPSAKFSPTRAFSSGLKRLLPLSHLRHYSLLRHFAKRALTLW